MRGIRSYVPPPERILSDELKLSIRKNWDVDARHIAAAIALEEYRDSVILDEDSSVDADIRRSAIQVGIRVGELLAEMKGATADEFIAAFEKDVLQREPHPRAIKGCTT